MNETATEEMEAYTKQRRQYLNIISECHELKDSGKVTYRYKDILQRLINTSRKIIHVLDVIKHATDPDLLYWLSDEKRVLTAHQIEVTFDYRRLRAEWKRDYNVICMHINKWLGEDN